MKILIAGDIVGSPGRTAFARVANTWKSQGKADVIVVNAENSAGGRGVTPSIAEDLFNAGADVLTLGDHTWDQRELGPHLNQEPRIIRPANYPEDCPGKGWVSVDTDFGKMTVINLMGRVFMNPIDCPFKKVDAILAKPNLGRIILVDMHAEATSEKIAMGRYLEGRVTAVVGTHTHVQTSDDCILPKGTAYITDLGMTGPHDSVLGRSVEAVTRRFVTGLPTRFDVADKDVRLEGVLVEADPKTGKATKITRVRERIDA